MYSKVLKIRTKPNTNSAKVTKERALYQRQSKLQLIFVSTLLLYAINSEEVLVLEGWVNLFNSFRFFYKDNLKP